MVTDPLEDLARALLLELGEDPRREGLRETPRRWARMWRDFVAGAETGPLTTFTSSGVDQMVVVGGLRLYTFCEHHLLPFWCEVSCGYIARDRVLGLSKFARIARSCASRLQVQEGLVEQIADALSAATHTDDVAVIARGQHLCLLMRGARSPHTMTSSAMRGVFLSKPEARAEFTQLAMSPAPQLS